MQPEDAFSPTYERPAPELVAAFDNLEIVLARVQADLAALTSLFPYPDTKDPEPPAS